MGLPHNPHKLPPGWENHFCLFDFSVQSEREENKKNKKNKKKKKGKSAEEKKSIWLWKDFDESDALAAEILGVREEYTVLEK